MAGTGRVPLWLVATVGGIAALTVLGIFIYGSYSGIGSSLWFLYYINTLITYINFVISRS